MWRRVTGQEIFSTLAEIKAKTISGTLREVEVEALVDTTADTLPEVGVRIMPTS